MEIQLKPIDHNPFPIGGVLIQGTSVGHWIKEIQAMGFALSAITVYPIPGTTANSVWGCLVEGAIEKRKLDVGRNRYCQIAHHLLFIPERCNLYPKILAGELEKLLHGRKHIMHPEFGLVELQEPVSWIDVIQLPDERPLAIKKPVSSLFIPKQIRSFQVKPQSPEAALEALEAQHFPKPEAFKDKPLNLLEKGKLAFYQLLFTKGKTEGSSSGTGRTSWHSQLEGVGRLFSKMSDKWVNGLQQDFEDLERRSQKHLDRLMELFKNNPEEALKYAIPLDTEGVSRGGHMGQFTLSKRWMDFSLFGGGVKWGSGSAVLPDSTYNQLYSQYLKTVQELTKQKEYKKAAFVYLKLLKNYPLAAQSLENGALYEEAASVYLKYCNDKAKAAHCYEQGKMPLEAIELYKELGENEKVGDLYTSILRYKEAQGYYQKVVDRYVDQHKHVKAALLYKNKMNSAAAAQSVLLDGWRSDRDAFNCLNNYFASIEDEKQRWAAIQAIYQEDVNEKSGETFLRVLRHEYEKGPGFAEGVKDMAYEVIVEQSARNPSIVSELRYFNQKDKQIIKDIMRFKMNLKLLKR